MKFAISLIALLLPFSITAQNEKHDKKYNDKIYNEIIPGGGFGMGSSSNGYSTYSQISYVLTIKYAHHFSRRLFAGLALDHSKVIPKYSSYLFGNVKFNAYKAGYIFIGGGAGMAFTKSLIYYKPEKYIWGNGLMLGLQIGAAYHTSGGFGVSAEFAPKISYIDYKPGSHTINRERDAALISPVVFSFRFLF